MLDMDLGAQTYQFVSNAIAQIIAIIVTVIGAAKWIDKKNDDKVKSVKLEFNKELEAREKGIRSDIKGVIEAVESIHKMIEAKNGFQDQTLTRHEHMIERLDNKNVSRFGGYYDKERLEDENR